ncbi:hypothetical protein M8C21_021686, partial [Ambrosia artemisiifolia]
TDVPALQVGELKEITPGLEVVELKKITHNYDAISVPFLQMDELKDITGNFGTISKIGEGLFGRVYHGVLRSGQPAAIKMLYSREQPGMEFLVQVFKASTLSHDNVLLTSMLQMDLFGIFFMARSKGTQQPGPVLTWAQRVKISIGVAKGLQYLHNTANIIHRNIKSSNVLLFADHLAKITDFEFSNQDYISTCDYNLGCRAPEYIMTGQASFNSDVYSFGVVLLELLTGRKPIDFTLPRSNQSLVIWATPWLAEDKVKRCVDVRLNGEYPLKAVAKMAAVAALCTQYEPEFRPHMGIVVKALQPLLDRSLHVPSEALI